MLWYGLRLGGESRPNVCAVTAFVNTGDLKTRKYPVMVDVGARPETTPVSVRDGLLSMN